MLASRLDMQIEAPARDDAGLRTRSAVATQPQIIVPRRPGIAYALLQTDADGRSEFILPLPGDAEEAVFPLHVDGAAHRALRVLMWPGRSVLDAGPLESTAQWERFRRPNYITRIGVRRQALHARVGRAGRGATAAAVARHFRHAGIGIRRLVREPLVRTPGPAV